MKNHLMTIAVVFILFVGGGFAGCEKSLEVDIQQLQEEVYEPTVMPHELLQPGTVLYLDHSTCVIDARQNSPVFNALRPQLGQYSDTLYLIKGNNIETIALNRSSNEVFQTLERIREDISYSNILRAVEQICAGSQQAILITDCEYIEENDLCHDADPYLSASFIGWLKRGYVVYVVVEPYQEKHRGKIYDKKRFYFFFTDDHMAAPISHNMLSEINASLNNGQCRLFKMTNSDMTIQLEGDLVERDLTSTVVGNAPFYYIEIDDSWNDIREYVMKLDKYDEPYPDESPLPLIKNLVYNHGENYLIHDIEIEATNITAHYVALDPDSEVSPAIVNIPDGFTLDKEALQNRRLHVMLTDKLFNYLTDEFGGNLIRLDFVVKSAGLKPYDDSMFKWPSLPLCGGGEAICVAKSIDNALRDIHVVPMSKERRVIQTVFLKTASYK